MYWPSPLRSRANSAWPMAAKVTKPAEKSAIGEPVDCGAPSGSPVRYIIPENAWPIRS